MRAEILRLLGRWVEAEANLQKYGTVVFTKAKFPVQSPYLGIANRAMEIMMKALVEFGMTPSSRSRVRVASAEQEDEFEKMFG